jgi:carboxyl-terminal processing protease
MRDKIWSGVCALSLVLVCVLPTLLRAQTAAAPGEDWTANTSMLLYFEAITAIRKNALQPLTSQHIVRDSLKAYVRGLDPFSDYLSPEEYATFRRLQQSHYAGVGMDISQDHSGHIVCLPYPDSPAAKAGIAAGDILEAIDGRSIVGQSVPAVGTQIRGQEGTAVQLRVANKEGVAQTITVIRAAVQAQSVLLERRAAFPIVRILSFTNRTPRELQETLRALPRSQAVVLDLRGNPGGSLYDAIDAAMLFLANGKKVVSIKTQDGLKDYYRDRRAAPLTVPLYLWQDAWTASAAEVFLAALHNDERAVSIGTKTFGKGTVQQMLPLADGSALYLTTGYLQTPDGSVYHERGLEPTYPLAMTAAQTRDYVAKTTALLSQQETTRLAPPGLPTQSGQAQPSTAPEHIAEP